MKPPYHRQQHLAVILPESPLAKVVGSGSIGVNSYHHQAIRCLAPGLETMAFSEDGLIEAVCRPESSFFWAVQWHPELSWREDPRQRAICKAFVEACG